MTCDAGGTPGLLGVMEAPSGSRAPFPPPSAPSQGGFQDLFCVNAKLLSLGSRQTAQGMDTPLCTGLTVLSLSLQIEFVTGTKKGTTANATATTTTTASTAVAGRGRSSGPSTASGTPDRAGASWVCLKRSVPRLGLAMFCWV